MTITIEQRSLPITAQVSNWGTLVTVSDDNVPAATRERLADVARRYFLEDRTKLDIAKELGISRFKVARLLDQARATGVVTITVHGPEPVDGDLSARLAQHLALDATVVARAGGRPVREAVGAAGAQWLQRELSPGEVLGLGWGRTLAAMVEAIERLPDVAVVQLTGAVGSDLTDSPVELVRKAALTSGGHAHPIFAPLLVSDADTAAALRRQPDIAAALALYDSVTTAVVSIGSWDPPSSQLREWMAPDAREDLQRRGVRAEVAATFVDDSGTLLGKDYVDRCLAITADQLRLVPRVVALAGGSEKARAVRAAACGGLVTALVTDTALAEEVLALPPVVTSRRG
jgi:DNA-binding transcriptional regulator LsrR (DeoR family)